MRENQEIQAYEIKTQPKTTKSMRSFQEKYSPENMLVMNEEKIERNSSETLLPLIFSEKASQI